MEKKDELEQIKSEIEAIINQYNAGKIGWIEARGMTAPLFKKASEVMGEFVKETQSKIIELQGKMLETLVGATGKLEAEERRAEELEAEEIIEGADSLEEAEEKLSKK